jgi:predicted esterase
MRRSLSLLALVVLAMPCLVRAADDDDVADVPSKDLRAGKDDSKRYFLIGAPKDAKAPKNGFGLLLVLPGGDGAADHHTFVKRIWKNALAEDYLVAQLVAVRWDPDVDITWPTARDKVPGKKFSTEKFVADVLDEVSNKHRVDPRRVYTLSWSSSGPAAYAVALANAKVKGSLIAMSVYKPKQLPALKKAKGHAFYLYHSPDDRVCPMWMARMAVRDLSKEGAKVELASYKGGHGWRGMVYEDIKKGMKWLEKQTGQ